MAQKKCSYCNGSGVCPHCHGTGRTKDNPHPSGRLTLTDGSGESLCVECEGTKKCCECGGTGWVED